MDRQVDLGKLVDLDSLVNPGKHRVKVQVQGKVGLSRRLSSESSIMLTVKMTVRGAPLISVKIYVS